MNRFALMVVQAANNKVSVRRVRVRVAIVIFSVKNKGVHVHDDTLSKEHRLLVYLPIKDMKKMKKRERRSRCQV